MWYLFPPIPKSTGQQTPEMSPISKTPSQGMSNPPSTTLSSSLSVTHQQPKQLEGIGPGENKYLLHAHDGRVNGSASCEFSQYSSKKDTISYSKLFSLDLFLTSTSTHDLQYLHFSYAGIWGMIKIRNCHSHQVYHYRKIS